MNNNIKTYIALFEKSDDGGYSVVFPDLPGCISVGDDFEDTCRMATEAANLHVGTGREEGDEVPEPRTLEQIKETWEDWGEWERDGNFLVVPISVLLESEAKRINITLPADLLFEVDRRTKNRSGFIAKALRAYL